MITYLKLCRQKSSLSLKSIEIETAKTKLFVLGTHNADIHVTNYVYNSGI
jgi:hypothetical protein